LQVQVLMPVHNEAETIASTIKEWYEKSKIDLQNLTFILSEDGSKDNTLKIILDLKNKYNINVITSAQRKGYSKAVVDAINSSKEGIICCVDSDGQCDPNDLTEFLSSLKSNPDKIISGVRTPRNDSILRKIMSKSFGVFYFLLFQIKMKDTSCPFVVGNKRSFHFISEEIHLDQGFWWEFHARRNAAKVEVVELEINHRSRLKGNSRVYSLQSISKIVWRHVKGLVALKIELINTK